MFLYKNNGILYICITYLVYCSIVAEKMNFNSELSEIVIQRGVTKGQRVLNNP